MHSASQTSGYSVNRPAFFYVAGFLMLALAFGLSTFMSRAPLVTTVGTLQRVGLAGLRRNLDAQQLYIREDSGNIVSLLSMVTDPRYQPGQRVRALSKTGDLVEIDFLSPAGLTQATRSFSAPISPAVIFVPCALLFFWLGYRHAHKPFQPVTPREFHIRS